MKFLSKVLILVTFLTLSTGYSFAVTAEPTMKDQEETKTKIDELKARVASRVAQLNLVERKAVLGTTSEVENTQITMKDLAGNTRFVDIDELTKIFNTSDKTIGISDIEKGNVISVLGLHNKQSKRILAREIKLTTVPKFGTGVVIAMDEEEYTVDVADGNKKVVLDIEKITKNFSYENGKLGSSGFSKINVGDNVVYVGYPNKDKKISASKLLLLPEIPPNPSVEIPKDALAKDAEVIPSTGSGKKLTPIKK